MNHVKHVNRLFPFKVDLYYIMFDTGHGFPLLLHIFLGSVQQHKKKIIFNNVSGSLYMSVSQNPQAEG